MRKLEHFRNLLGACALGLLMAGCASSKSIDKEGKEKSFMSFHLQEPKDSTERSGEIQVYREHPVTINVHKVAAMDEGNIEKAEVINDVGGFAIKLKFDRRGSWLLENLSAAYRGRQLAIMAVFGDTKDKVRWIAAPYLSERITNGTLVFTPDATREEAERIVLGLNHVREDVRNKSHFKDSD